MSAQGRRRARNRLRLVERPPLAAALLLALTLLGCEILDGTEGCYPVTGRGCQAGEMCAIAVSGDEYDIDGSRCVPEGKRGLGASCASPSECKAGLLCWKPAGGKCVRLCETDDDCGPDPFDIGINMQCRKTPLSEHGVDDLIAFGVCRDDL